MMVNGNMSNDLVQLIPEERDRHKQHEDHRYTSKSSLSGSSLLTANGAMKSDFYQLASPSSSNMQNHKNSKNKRTCDIPQRDARSVIDVPNASNQGTVINISHPQERPPRVRCQSAPGHGSSIRRTLFDSFWKKKDSDNSLNRSNSGSNRSSPTPSVSVGCEGDGDSQGLLSATKSLSSSQNERKRPESVSLTTSPVSCRKSHDRHTKSNGNRESNINIMRFSPPVKYTSTLRSRFEDLHELPDSLQQLLPPLPSPLRRICHSDGSLSSCGVYPLLSPRSILQKSSYGTSPMGQQQQTGKQQQGLQEQDVSPCQTGENRKTPASGSPPYTMIMSLPLNLTDSMRHLDAKDLADDISPRSSGVETSDDTTSSLSTIMNRRVQFDPRVTISEYDDSAPRQWYADTDLDLMKIETIALAQRYLVHHPDVAAEYCVGKVDPITGCIRKKTLYSLPILNDVSVDDDEHDDNTEGNVDGSSRMSGTSSKGALRTAALSCEYAERARTHVKKILVVDPNTLILELFRRSLLQIFPHAEVTTVQTGEEALLHTKRAWSQSSLTVSPRAFDICIIEERLRSTNLKKDLGCPTQQRRSVLGANNGSVAVKDASTAGSAFAPTGPGSELFQPKFASGSDVIAKLKQLEDEFCRPDRCILEDDELEDLATSPPSSAPVHCVQPDESAQQRDSWRSLVVGVCIDQKHDAVRLWQNGCDMVWPKPPPPMGENVRNQLVSLLVKKRTPSIVTTGYHQELSM